MSYTEIFNEINKDYDALYRYAENKINDNKYFRAGMKFDSPHNFNPIYWTSPGKNRYVIIPQTNGKKSLKKYGMCYTIFCYYFDEKNYLNAVMVNRRKFYYIYRSHLFDRYAERFLEDTTMNKIEVMVEFISNNTQITGTPFETASNHTNSIFGRVVDGAVLGTLNDGILVFNTFITIDMLKGTEIEYNNALQINIDKAVEANNTIPLEILERKEQERRMMKFTQMMRLAS